MDTAAAATATAVGEPTMAMEEELRKEGEQVEEPVEAMEQVAEEREEISEPTEATEQVEEQREEIGGSAEATEQVEEEREEPAEPMEQVGEEPEEVAEPMEQVAEEREEAEAEDGASLRPSLPVGRVKRIMRVDRDIKKVTNEATLLVAAATELFLGSLAAGAHTAAARRGRRTVRAAHIRAAARAHRPTADFLLDCLDAEEEAPRARPVAGSAGGGGGREAKPLPRGTRRIDAFFQKVN
jgi:DNA-directed RNA polymerase I subunit RPA43